MGYRADNYYYFRASITGDMQHLGRALFRHLVVDDTTNIKIEPLRYAGPDSDTQPYIARGLQIEVTFMERYPSHLYDHSATYKSIQDVVSGLLEAHEHRPEQQFRSCDYSLYTHDNMSEAGDFCHPTWGYEVNIETGERVEIPPPPKISVVEQLRIRAAVAKAQKDAAGQP